MVRRYVVGQIRVVRAGVEGELEYLHTGSAYRVAQPESNKLYVRYKRRRIIKIRRSHPPRPRWSAVVWRAVPPQTII
jgi:hypothetical protein